MTRITMAAPLALLAMLGGCGESTAPTNTIAAGDSAAADNTADAAVADTSWTGLRDLIGQYPRDVNLFGASAITGDLKALLGEKFDVFVQNMDVQGPLTEDNGVLWTSGNKAHQGGVDAAYLLIDPATHQLEAGLWEKGALKTYASPGAPIAKPADVQTLLAHAERPP